MSQFTSFTIYNSSGLPDSSATPTFLVYKNASNITISHPTITNYGGGIYAFNIPDLDVEAGVAYLIASGVALPPQYFAGSNGTNLQAFALYNYSGVPTAGATPSFVTYVNASDTPVTAPSIVDFGLGLYTFLVPSLQYETGVAFEINSGSGFIPARLNGYIQQPVFVSGSAPVVSNVMPPTGSRLFPNQSISFDITSPNDSAFRAINILAQYPSLGVYEVIYDGLIFAANYSGTISSITDGFAFTNVLRFGGWPAPPTILPIAIDIYGNENL